MFYLSGKYFMREACPPTSDWTLFANVKECAGTLPSQQMSIFFELQGIGKTHDTFINLCELFVF